MEWQSVVALCIVALAAAALLAQGRRWFDAKGGSCGGCHGCSPSSSLKTREQQLYPLSKKPAGSKRDG
jgi:hypothetical protein